jgi:iron complex outermembrane receptor protein
MTTARWGRALAAVAGLWALAVYADPRVEARRHFKTGMFLITDGRYDEAITELLEAYAIKPHPNVLFNVARAHEAAGRPGEAVAFYQRYLATTPPDAEKVRSLVAKLEPLIVKTEAPADGKSPARPKPSVPAVARSISGQAG